MCETWMLAQPHHGAAVRCDGTRRIDCAEIDQQLARRGERCRWRRREPGQGRDVADAPRRQLEGQRREIAIEDLRWREGQQAALSLLRPQPIAHARFETAGAAAPLVGRGLAYA